MDTLLFVQVQPAALAGSGAALGATSVILQSFQTIDGVDLAMTDFGTIGYGTLEPGAGTQEEQISFTGITQNANGTATLTGVKTVLFIAPYTETSGLAKSHAGGVKFVISNTAGFYNKMTSKANDETITGIWTFTQPAVPRLDSAYTYTGSDNEYFATKRYVDGVAIAGAPDASTSTKGIAKSSVAPASASEPIFVGDNDPRVPTQDENNALVGTSGSPSTTNKYVTNDDTSATAAASKVVRSNGSSKIAEGYLNITDAQATTLTGGTSSNASSLHTHNSLSRRLATLTSDVTVAATTTETTIFTHTLAANSLSTANVVHGRINISDFDAAAGAQLLTLRAKYGATTIATCALDPNGARSNYVGFLDYYLIGAGTTSAQEGSMNLFVTVNGAAINTGDPNVMMMSVGSATEDSTGALAVALTAQWSTTDANSVTFANGFLEIIAG